jgi:hypothetical protein
MHHSRFGIMIARRSGGLMLLRTARGNSERNTLDLRSGPLPGYSGDASAFIAGERWYFSRAEITDAVMNQRAECVMLKKSPHIIAASRTMDHILQCISDKSSMLRALKLAQDFEKIAITPRRISKNSEWLPSAYSPPRRRVLRYSSALISRISISTDCPMNESMPSAESYDANEIAAISEKLQVSANDVVEVYKGEFTRLHAQARIKTYVGVLAMSNTKSILHKTTSRRC